VELMASCSRCSGELSAEFRFCPWCAARQRSKLVEFFRAHPHIARDRGKALRASVYLDAEQRQVRLSVWRQAGDVEASVSLDPGEARRLAAFLGGALGAEGHDVEETQPLSGLGC
jgi:hypothetical protein